MPKLWRFSLFLMALSLLGVLIGALSSGSFQAVEPELRPEIRGLLSKDPTERSWRRVTITRVLTISSEAETGSMLFGPVISRTDSDHNVWVLDYGDLKIKKFDPRGVLVESYGEGSGQGPGEFINPTDFVVTADGTLVVCDPVKGELMVFGPGGGLLKSIKIDGQIFRIALPGNGDLISMALQASDGLFRHYDHDFLEQSRFGHLLHTQGQHGMALDGWIVGLGNGRAAYAPNRIGLLALIGPGGVETVVETMVQASPPAILVDSVGGRRIDPAAPRVSYGVSVSEGHIYVLSATSSKPDGQRCFDVYDTEGRYQYSSALPESVGYAYVAGGFLYTVGEAEVSKWRFRHSA